MGGSIIGPMHELSSNLLTRGRPMVLDCFTHELVPRWPDLEDSSPRVSSPRGQLGAKPNGARTLLVRRSSAPRPGKDDLTSDCRGKPFPDGAVQVRPVQPSSPVTTDEGGQISFRARCVFQPTPTDEPSRMIPSYSTSPLAPQQLDVHMSTRRFTRSG
jgi:hypothetical protein